MSLLKALRMTDVHADVAPTPSVMKNMNAVESKADESTSGSVSPLTLPPADSSNMTPKSVTENVCGRKRPIGEITGEVDATSALRVHKQIMKIVDTCDSLVSIPPDRFLKKILRNRGYECDSIPFTKKVHPTAKQIQDYDQELVSAVKDSDVTKINQLHANGRCMSACNKFGESIVHIALRRGSMELVDFMLQHGADPGIVDDYGRVPLHDACWRPEPRFDIVTLLLDRNVDSLRMLDARGYSPLKYVREQHWVHWCVFLFHMTERFWPQHKSAENIGVEVGDYATASKDK